VKLADGSIPCAAETPIKDSSWPLKGTLPPQ
jgi:hypothetical protein